MTGPNNNGTHKSFVSTRYPCICFWKLIIFIFTNYILLNIKKRQYLLHFLHDEGFKDITISRTLIFFHLGSLQITLIVPFALNASFHKKKYYSFTWSKQTDTTNIIRKTRISSLDWWSFGRCSCPFCWRLMGFDCCSYIYGYRCLINFGNSFSILPRLKPVFLTIKVFFGKKIRLGTQSSKTLY